MEDMTVTELARTLRTDMVQRRLSLRAACIAHGLPYKPTYDRLQANGYVLRTTLIRDRRLTAK